MATQTLTVTLGLSAVNAVNGIFSLNASETDSLSYNDTAATSATVSVATGSATQLVASAVAKKTYAYVKNLDTSNWISLENDAGNIWGRLGPGEFAFFPVGVSVGLEVQADTAACVVEYALFQEP